MNIKKTFWIGMALIALSGVAALGQANDDMANLLAGTGIATIFVDHQLRIQRFTPAATQIIRLLGTDVGRPVADLASRLVAYGDLVADVQKVLNRTGQSLAASQTNRPRPSKPPWA